MSEQPITPDMCAPDSFNEYIGCTSLKQRLSVAIKAAKHRSMAVPPLFFYGGPGSGKTTLAKLLASERGAHMVIFHGSTIGIRELNTLFGVTPGSPSRSLSMAGECKFNKATNKWVLGPTGEPRPTTVVIFDECERISKTIFQSLYSTVGDNPAYFADYQGNQSRFYVPAWTPVFITNHPEQAMKNACGLFEPGGRCAIQHNFDIYATNELQDIISQFAFKIKVPIDKAATSMLAQKANGTPRQALYLFNQAYSYLSALQSEGHKGVQITVDIADKALELEGYDSMGLSQADRNYLIVLTNEPNGSIALPSLAAKLGVAKETIERIIEPKLVRLDLLRISGIGRSITDIGRDHISAAAGDRVRPSLRLA